MTKITSAYAYKLLRKLKEEKEYLECIERDSSTYVSADDEEPVIPEYDYADIAGKIKIIDEK